MRAIFLVCGLPLTCRPVGHRTRSQGRRYFVFRRRPPSRAMPQRKFSGLIEGELFPGPALSGCSLNWTCKGERTSRAASRTRWRALPFCTLVYFFHTCVRDGRACISGDEALISRPLRAQRAFPSLKRGCGLSHRPNGFQSLLRLALAGSLLSSLGHPFDSFKASQIKCNASSDLRQSGNLVQREGELSVWGFPRRPNNPRQ
jgi:hypothetical protein